MSPAKPTAKSEAAAIWGAVSGAALCSLGGAALAQAVPQNLSLGARLGLGRRELPHSLLAGGLPHFWGAANGRAVLAEQRGGAGSGPIL